MRKLVASVLVATILMFLLSGCGTLAGKAYIFKCVDTSGNPVKGVSLQVCSDTQCMLYETDDTGVAVCENLPQQAYEVHVLTCPEGYTYDKEEVYVTAKTYETHTFTLSDN